LLAQSSLVLWWNNHLSLENIRVFHFAGHLPFVMFCFGEPTSSYATADINGIIYRQPFVCTLLI
jgi:hypothetical protein